MEDSIWYTYRHLKPNGEVFYIGIGKSKNFKRAFEKDGRSTYWKNKVKKYPDYEVQILKTGLTKEDACELEKILISWYGRADCCGGTLVNLTDGGEGIIGYICSEEDRLKISQSKLYTSDETRIKMSNSAKNRKHSDDSKNKMAITWKNKFLENEVPFILLCRRKVICYVTNKEWDSIKDCAEYNNISYSGLRKKLCGERKNNTTFVYKNIG